MSTCPWCTGGLPLFRKPHRCKICNRNYCPECTREFDVVDGVVSYICPNCYQHPSFHCERCNKTLVLPIDEVRCYRCKKKVCYHCRRKLDSKGLAGPEYCFECYRALTDLHEERVIKKERRKQNFEPARGRRRYRPIRIGVDKSSMEEFDRTIEHLRVKGTSVRFFCPCCGDPKGVDADRATGDIRTCERCGLGLQSERVVNALKTKYGIEVAKAGSNRDQ